MPKGEDKEEKWEKRKSEIEEEREIRSAFTTNIGHDADKFLAILSGQYKAPRLPTDSDRIFRNTEVPVRGTRSIPKIAAITDTDGEVEEANMERELPRYNHPQQVNKYAEFIEQLDRIPFLKDEKKLKEVTALINSAIRTSLNHMILNEVAGNTKKAFTQYCLSVVKIAGGLKVTFNLGGNDIIVTAKGSFYGDETICVHKKDGNTLASVIKVHPDSNDGSYTDLSSQFELNLQQRK